ncbi:MAG: succinate dehydrogenase assembly factor 2 [Pseudomonadota bacterium]
MITSDDPRLRRLNIRSWRRGTKEMDMILGPWSDAHLANLEPDEIDAYEALLGENDQDLYLWVSGQAPIPDAHSGLLSHIRAFAELGPDAS